MRNAKLRAVGHEEGEGWSSGGVGVGGGGWPRKPGSSPSYLMLRNTLPWLVILSISLEVVAV